MKIAVGMSGGIDSSTTALILKEQGHEVIGITMFLFEHQEAEIKVAKQVCKELDIPHHVLDYRDAFYTEIISDFIRSYECGETPNPCLKCNRLFKYGQLLKDAAALSAEAFATGHYARIFYNEETEQYELHKAINERKDQSYNLYHLTQDSLVMLHFPLGDAISKDEVRARFSAVESTISEKKDSLGICFISHKQHEVFLKDHQSHAMKRGAFVDKSGKILGYHQGIAGFTIGQKKRIPVRTENAFVVVEIRPDTLEVVLGTEDDLLKHEIHCEAFNFLSGSESLPLKVTVKVSQWSTLYSGTLTQCNDNGAILVFDEPVRAPALGQAAVCYVGTRLVGGGVISGLCSVCEK